MNVSPKICDLLQEILNGECDRSRLANWLATSSLQFLESDNERDRMIIADLDAALGEIQRGAQAESFVADTANRLVAGLEIGLTDLKVTVNMTGSNIDLITGTDSVGGNAMTKSEIQVVASSS